MNIRKVLASSLAAITAGATLAFGAFGAISDMVATSDSRLTSPVIVIGDPAPAKDVLGAADIAAAVAGYAASPVSVAGVAAATVTGGAPVRTAARNLYLGESFTAAKGFFLEKDLPDMLAGGVVTQDNGDEVSYMEKLTPGTQTVSYNKDFPDSEKPELNIEIGEGDQIYEYTVIFYGGLDVGEEIADQRLVLMGTEYQFTGRALDLTNESLTMYGGGVTEVVLVPGQSESVVIEGESHTFELIGVSAGSTQQDNSATIKVNGVSKEVDYGETITVAEQSVWVKAIHVYTYPEQGDIVLSIGAQEITLTSGEEIEIGGEEIEGTSGTTITAVDADTISKINVIAAASEDEYLMAGDTYTDPVFQQFKIAFGGVSPGLKDASKGKIVVDSEDSSVEIEFTTKAGDKLDQVVFNGSAVLADGKDDEIRVIEGETIYEDDYFVVSYDEFSHILQWVDTDEGEGSIELKDVASGKTFTQLVTEDIVLEYDFDILTYNLTTREITVNMSRGEVPTSAVVPLYIVNSAMINLSNTAGDPAIFVVEPDYSEYTGAPARDTVNLSFSSDGTNIQNVAVNLMGTTGFEGLTDEDTDISYSLSRAGTFVAEDTDEDPEDVEIWVGEAPTVANVAFGRDPSFAAGEGAVCMSAVKISQPVSKLASEVQSMINAGTLRADVILVGGPCANSLVATLAEAGHLKTCNAWDYSTGVIKEVEDAFVSGKNALIVAGTAADDTRSLAAKVMTGVTSYQA